MRNPEIIDDIGSSDIMALLGYVSRFQGDSEVESLIDEINKRIRHGVREDLRRCYDSLERVVKIGTINAEYSARIL